MKRHPTILHTIHVLFTRFNDTDKWEIAIASPRAWEIQPIREALERAGWITDYRSSRLKEPK